MDRKIPTTLWKTQLLKLVSEAPKANLVECDEIGYQRFPSTTSTTTTSSSGDDSDQSIQSLSSAVGGDLNLVVDRESSSIRRNRHHHHNTHHHSRHSLRRLGVLENDDKVLLTSATDDISSSLSVGEIGLDDFQRCLRLSIKSPLHNNLIESNSNCSNSVESSNNSHSPSPPQPILDDDEERNNDSPINGSLSRCDSRSNTVDQDELVIPSSLSPKQGAVTSAPPWDKPDFYLYNPFGNAFHGYLSHSQTKQRLVKDGQYLVRKSASSDDDFVLSVRFNGHIKHYILVFDDTSGLIYAGDREKGYEKLEELVQSGLITLYLDQKAGPYIDLMCDLTQFNNQRNHPSHHRQQLTNIRNGSSHCVQQNHLSNKYQEHHSLHLNGHTSSPSSHSTLINNTIMSSSLVNGTKLPSLKFSTSQSSNQTQPHSPSPSVSSLSRSSVERQRITDLWAHSFQVHTFQELSKCQICQNFLWGLSSQGLLCEDCNLITHESCAERLKSECRPQLSHIAQVFGTKLPILVKAAGGSPFVIQKCITEIEKRGLHIEGIYRVSGSREQTERLKKYLEQERESADMSQFPDIHSMCGLVKLYFRVLPQPLITNDVFQLFLNAGEEMNLEVIKRDLKKLPPAHYVTLRHLLRHLHQVAQWSDRNKMNPFNLSSVFAPSLLCPTQLNMSTLKQGTTALEMMIINVPILFPKN